MNLKTWASTLILAWLATGTITWAAEGTASETVAGSQILPASEVAEYPDHRPSARYRLEARDQGVVFRHGTGPGQCDHLGARDAWVFESDGVYYMHYDGAGPRGWLCCLATSKDLLNWTAKGPVLDFGRCGLGLLDEGPQPLECRPQSGGARRRQLYLEPQMHRSALCREGGHRLALLYDAPGGDSKRHMQRDVGLAWLQLPLLPPTNESGLRE